MGHRHIRFRRVPFFARPLKSKITGKHRFPLRTIYTYKIISRVLDVKEKGKTTTARAHTELLELRNALSRNLLELRQSQEIYMPGLTPLLEGDEHLDGPIKLWLPSELSDGDRAKWCLPGIPNLELRFRYAQADDSLAEIRRLRRLLQGVQDQNAKHLSQTQRNITRSKGVFNGFTARISRAVKRYRHSRQAMLVLDPSQQLSPGWMNRFQVLEDSDVRGPGRESYEQSEGRFQPSWIWQVPQQTGDPPDSEPSPSGPTTTTSLSPGPGGSAADPISAAGDQEVANSMRVHWAKCQARADQYEEEVVLTVEEMGRTLRYFEWKRLQWLSLQSSREQSATPPPIDVQQGLHAYAHRQAHIYEALIVSFVGRWRKVLVPHNLGSDWLHHYSVAPDPLSARPSRGHSRPTAGPSLTAVNDLSNQTDSPPSSSLVPPPDTDASIDPPIESDPGSDDDSDYADGGWEESDFED